MERPLPPPTFIKQHGEPKRLDFSEAYTLLNRFLGSQSQKMAYGSSTAISQLTRLTESVGVSAGLVDPSVEEAHEQERLRLEEEERERLKAEREEALRLAEEEAFEGQIEEQEAFEAQVDGDEYEQVGEDEEEGAAIVDNDRSSTVEGDEEEDDEEDGDGDGDVDMK